MAKKQAVAKEMPKVDKDFPLWWHKGNQCFARKVRGKMYYFGPDPQIALEEWLHAKPYLMAGRDVPETDSFTVGVLTEKYLRSQRLRLDQGKIKARSLDERERCCAFLDDHLGNIAVAALGPEDFMKILPHIKGTPAVRGNKILRVRSVFKFAFDNDLIDRPVRFGTEFVGPSQAEKRKHRAQKPKKLFTAAEIRQLVEKANPLMKAAILLGINSGILASDLASMERRHIDGDWVIFARPKTGIDRMFWLWPETKAAIEAAARPEGLLFLRRGGKPVVSEREGGQRTDVIGQGFWMLKKRIGLEGTNRGFEALRHTYRTIADEVGDQPGVMLTMGHSDGTINAIYREQIENSRLETISRHVRKWLALPRLESGDGSLEQEAGDVESSGEIG